MTRSNARKYAQGLIGALPAGTDLDAVANGVVAAARALAAHGSLREVLVNPGIANGVKGAIVDALLASASARPEVRHFLRLVAGHGHGADLGFVADAVRAEVDELQGIVPAGIRSVRELASAERERLTEVLGRVVDRKLRATFATDPELLAGVVARVGDVVFDGSARRQLALMRERLTQAG